MRIDWFLHKVHRSHVDASQERLIFLAGSKHHRSKNAALTAQITDQFYSIFAGHEKVSNKKVEILCAKDLQCLDSVSHAKNGKTTTSKSAL